MNPLPPNGIRWDRGTGTERSTMKYILWGRIGERQSPNINDYILLWERS